MRIADDDILSVAMSLFAEKGYASVSTKEIAQKAGITEMTLFRKFHTKRELLIRIISTQRRNEIWIDPTKYADPGECFKDYIRAILDATESEKEISRIILTSPEVLDRDILEIARKRLDSLQENIGSFIMRLMMQSDGPAYSKAECERLAFHIFAQLIGFYYLDNVAGVAAPPGMSWEALREDFAERLRRVLFGV
jgi:TetR/AcrR family transcriptional regulator